MCQRKLRCFSQAEFISVRLIGPWLVKLTKLANIVWCMSRTEINKIILLNITHVSVFIALLSLLLLIIVVAVVV